ncbi:MAG TPA: TonB family protein [Gemmatimonadales bacterium]|nr:TonB family protein [Gemmatimonadales bacterium]
MFENLIESKPVKQRTIGQTIASVVVHVLLVLVAIKATQGAAEVVQQLNERPIEFVVNAPPPPPPPPPQELPPDVVVSSNPPPQGFQTIVPPKDLPTEIPPVDLNQKFDARDFSGKGVAGGVATGIVGGDGPVITDVVSGTTYTDDEVDEPVQPLRGPEPRYPEVMKSVGIEGVVQLRFVVGTNGRAEANSIQVVSSTNKAFEQPAIDAIRQWRFSPAKLRGQPVRQLVQQNVRFSLQRGG